TLPSIRPRTLCADPQIPVRTQIERRARIREDSGATSVVYYQNLIYEVLKMRPISEVVLALTAVAIAPLFAQTSVWTVSDNGRTIKQVILPTSSESQGGSPPPVFTPNPIKVDAGTPTRVDVRVSPGVAPSGNWFRFVPVAPNADCSRAAYNTYPTTFSAVTPI